jgi:hypothetical protein
MLLRTLFVVAFLAALGATIVHATASLANARVHRRATLAVDRAVASALAAVQSAIATQIQSSADPRALQLEVPNTATSCAAYHASTCALTITTTLDATAEAAPSGSPCAPLCASDVQGNDAIAEGRTSVRVRVVATGSDGTSLAMRDRYVVFRVWKVAPYVALAGTRDVSTDAIANGTSEGDDAGTPAVTTVGVRYVNTRTGASVEGNAWSSQGWSNSNASVTDWDP